MTAPPRRDVPNGVWPRDKGTRKTNAQRLAKNALKYEEPEEKRLERKIRREAAGTTLPWARSLRGWTRTRGGVRVMGEGGRAPLCGTHKHPLLYFAVCSICVERDEVVEGNLADH